MTEEEKTIAKGRIKLFQEMIALLPEGHIELPLYFANLKLESNLLSNAVYFEEEAKHQSSNQ